MNRPPVSPDDPRWLATSDVAVPAIILDAGADALHRYIEFFTASIRNENTRWAYLRAVRRFFAWAQRHRFTLQRIDAVVVAAYIEELMETHADLTVKQHLAGIRMMFDYLVTGGILRFNPAAAVKGPKVVILKGKTPVLTAAEARRLLDSIDTSTLIGLRDRALIGVLIYTFARIGAALKMRVADVRKSDGRYWIRLHEKGGRHHSMPLHHEAERYLIDYLDATGLRSEPDTPLFRAIGRQHVLKPSALHRNDALRMIKRRALATGISADICCHTFRATGITEYMRNGGTLEKAQTMAAHASSRTTNLYNRTSDQVSLDEVERLQI